MSMSFMVTSTGTYTNGAVVSSDMTVDPNPDDDMAGNVVVAQVYSPTVIHPVGAFGSGGFHLSITGPAVPTTIQASTNLVNWVDLASGVPPMSFTDTNVGSFPTRFYRAIFGP
jgi:hypothetical protein